MSHTRPDTVAEMLEKVARLLDAGEGAFDALARLTGKPHPLTGGKAVQQDLRTLAARLGERPDLDAEVYALLDR